MPIQFYVDPATNSNDPEIRMAYGLHVVSPWEDTVFINFPEHLEYMPGTRGIARHHDPRDNVWQIEDSGERAHYRVESLSERDVFFSAEARANANRAHFSFSIKNNTPNTLHSIRPMFCHDYGDLNGFPAVENEHFFHTFVTIDGRLVALSELPVSTPTARARMAQVSGCPDHHNWWAKEMGGLIETPIDFAFTAVQGNRDRYIALSWTPGKCLLSNHAIPCIHADPFFGDLAPGTERTARGQLIFGMGPLENLVAECAALAERPWEN